MKTIFWNKSRLMKRALVPGAIFLLLVLFILLVRSSRSGSGEPSNVIRSERFQHLNTIKEPFLDLTKNGNFEPDEEPIKEGPGEGGEPYTLPESRKVEASKSIGLHKGICVTASDDISLTRAIPDTRMEECKHWNYPEYMGLTASIVLVFHNEGFSTLMRNVHTIFKRSPPEMIEEIILVDDCSNLEDTKDKLEEYIKRWNGKVKIFRNTEREGLIRTRNTGAQKSKGDVVIFLDAHCEVNRNWLPPLLAPIYRNRKTMTVPFIDGVNYKSFEYRPVYAANALVRGIWEWGFFYKEMDLTPEQVAKRKSKSEPYKSPTHAGGLFAIDRKYFEELGYYDDGLHIWGGEQYELSFKIWQCGGSIEWIPCSRIGHIYRGPVPAGYHVADKCKSKNDAPYIVQKNYKRVIEVWWEDKYKEFFYTRDPLTRYLDHGDISKQLEFKKRNECKSFAWFMENVAPDQLIKFPELPPNLFWGEMRNHGSDTCFDTMNHGPGGKPGLSGCYGTGNQLARLNTKGQIGMGERCLDVEGNVPKIVVCPEGSVSGPWEYDVEKKTMLHTRLVKCLAVNPSNSELIMRKCESSSLHHQWTWKESRP